MASPYHPRAPFLEEEVIAYHGTSLAAAKTIVQEQEFRISEKPDEWLGRGAYFFQGSIHRARQWAASHHAEPAVVSVRIKVGHCIDLLDNRWHIPLQAIAKELQLRREAEGKPALANQGLRHRLDCAAINQLSELWRPETIRAAYHEGEPSHPDSLFGQLDHIQIAVRDPRQSIREIRHDEDWLT